MITQEKIDRINFIARKSRKEGLTEEEAKEQKALRGEYVAAFRKSLETQLDSTVIVRPDGTRDKIERKKPNKFIFILLTFFNYIIIIKSNKQKKNYKSSFVFL